MQFRTLMSNPLHPAAGPGEMLALEPRYLFDAAAVTTAADATTDSGSGDTSTATNDSSAGTSDSSQQDTVAFLDALATPAAVVDTLVDDQIFNSFENLPAGATVGRFSNELKI